MIIEKLNWDTEFFGIKVGRIILAETDNFDPVSFEQQVKEDEFELVYIISLKKILNIENKEQLKLNLMDVQITMSKKFNPNEYSNIPYEFRTELSETELQECYRIAEQTATVSRFYKEPLIGPEKTKELYRKWIDNALDQSFSDGLFVERTKNTIVGVHIIKTNNTNKLGLFTLTGVDENIKRMGLGSKLWNQSFGYWSNTCELECINSPFSLQNMESFNFHLKMGFNKLEEIKYIYHYSNKL
ncbi:dTDP-4-amino-4,6-dideoxy-D-galactose acyltransferase [Flavobacterium sp. CG_9.10]|uniref:GNAT family N-acetyltransferase n=1 Tax=Flavobacterium sp. CG_9.10 TaxID=2787729 RepID=UPI0018C98F02|nr:GNAT family N-acetyltransferase [Flavobacterium sp. CG_9.10]MBG6109885.1 dTDP-4-amino-4,6-dideoxy-D-galactose acyltransferase [Flavobacterium sp. CG_9.10]